MQIKNVRFIVAVITTFSAYAVYVSRVNLSIAIIAMVDDHHAAAAAAASSASSSLSSQTKAAGDGSSDHKLATRQADASYIGGDGFDLTASIPGEQRNFAPDPSQFSPVEDLSPLAYGNNNNNNNRSANAATVVGAQNVNNSNNNINGSRQDNSNTQHREPLTTFFLTPKKSVKTPLISQEKFHWDQTEQGHILGAFFYGYILFQIPGARMAESVGAKWIIMAANAGSAVISLVFPLSTQLNSIHLLMVLRFVMGLCQSAFFPAAYVLFCRWLPERERSVLLPIMFIGSNMGSISTYIMSSYLISSNYGWPSVFYLSGLVCTIVSLLWCIFGSNGPEDNWLITDKEKQFILHEVNQQSSGSNSLNELRQFRSESIRSRKSLRSNSICCGNLTTNAATKNASIFSKQHSLTTTNLDCCQQQTAAEAAAESRSSSLNNCCADQAADLESNIVTKTHGMNASTVSIKRIEPQEPSWPKLLKSIPIWTLILSMYGNEWSNVVLCYELPTYLNTALNFPIEQNGQINSFFQLSYAVASPIMSSLGAYMLGRHLFGMRKIHVRKLFQSLATFGQLACFVSVPICGANRGLIIMFMFSAIVFKACSNAGDIMVSGDLSPEYAGTIFAFANSIGNTAGFFAPLLAGAFVENAYEREQWTPFWLTTAAIMCFSGLIFLIFGETRRQDFALDSNSDLLGGTKTKTTTKHQSDIDEDDDTSDDDSDVVAANERLLRLAQLELPETVALGAGGLTGGGGQLAILAAKAKARATQVNNNNNQMIMMTKTTPADTSNTAALGS